MIYNSTIKSKIFKYKSNKICTNLHAKNYLKLMEKKQERSKNGEIFHIHRSFNITKILIVPN